jgi:hypothetical protein
LPPGNRGPSFPRSSGGNLSVPSKPWVAPAFTGAGSAECEHDDEWKAWKALGSGGRPPAPRDSRQRTGAGRVASIRARSTCGRRSQRQPTAAGRGCRSAGVRELRRCGCAVRMTVPSQRGLTPASQLRRARSSTTSGRAQGRRRRSARYARHNALGDRVPPSCGTAWTKQSLRAPRRFPDVPEVVNQEPAPDGWLCPWYYSPPRCRRLCTQGRRRRMCIAA